MSSDAPWLSLDDLVEDIIDRRGVTPLKLGGLFTSSGHRVISAKLLKGGRIDLSADEPRYVNSAVYAKWMKGPLLPGDVLMTFEAPLGELAYINANLDWCLGQRLFAIRPRKDRLDGCFAYYALQTRQVREDLIGRSTGTTVQGIRQSELRRVRLPVPDLSLQVAAASVLKAIDDRIALLRETNATLEAIAQALFKSWFVDFDPVRARSQGLAPAGMDEATAALFPDSFEESALGLGLVPKGWKVRALDEIATYLNGLALQKFSPSDDSWLPVIKIAQFRKGDTVGADRAGRNLKPEYIVQNGDVLFSWSGSLEVEVWCGGEGALNQHLFKVKSKEFPKWFYLHWTRHHLDHFRQIAAGKATTMGHIQRAHLSEAKVLVSPAALLGAMDAYFAPLLARIVQYELQAHSLATLRDTLLPRLISGQLRLPEAETALTT